MTLRRELVAAITAGGAALALHRRRPVALRRTAASGREVTLAGGPAVVTGLLLAQFPSPTGTRARSGRGGTVAGFGRPAAWGRASPAGALPVTLAVTLAAVAGLVDDLAEEVVAGTVGRDRGLRGHLAALRSGRMTTGVGKVFLIGTGALAAALVLDGGRPRGPASPRRHGAGPPHRVARTVTDAVLIAGTANLLNLFDTRPGRAGKVAVVADAVLGTALRRSRAGGARAGARRPSAASGTAVAVLPGMAGVLVGTLPGDLRGLWMLGDCGANALGAALGVRAAAEGGPLLRAGWLVSVLALTAASERVSFTAVIARHRVLEALDRLGRR